MRRSVLGVLVLVFVLVFGSTAGAFTQTAKLNLLGSGLTVDYETKKDDQFSYIVGGSLASGNVLGASAGLRYYLEPGSMQGIYGEGRVTAAGVFFGGFAVVAGAGASGGYKYVLDNGLTFDGGAGLATTLFVLSSVGGGVVIQPGLDIRVGVGYSW